MRELGLRRGRGREGERRPGRQIVHDFEHRRAFVARAGLAGQNFHRGGQVAGRLDRREGVDTIGKDAPLDAGAGRREVIAGLRREMREVPFRRVDLVRDPGNVPTHRVHRRQRRQGLQIVEPDPGRD